MLSDTDYQALVDVAMKRLQITFTYQKTSGDQAVVQHTGGVVEINADTGFLWVWDTSENDHIRRFFLSNILNLQVYGVPFDNGSAGGYPLKINGQIMTGVI